MENRTSSQIAKISKKLAIYAIVSAPLLIYWIYWTLHPSYWSNADPSAWYFLDSLAIFAGKTYRFVDHPGVPVQIIGSILLGITYPFFKSKEAFIQFYIAKPEYFFFMAHIFLLITNSLNAWLLYQIASTNLKNNKTLGGIAIALTYFAIHHKSFTMLNFWTHNALYFSLGSLWWIFYYREMSSEKEVSPKKLFFFGVTAGMLAMIQAFFIPWLVAGIFGAIIYSWRLGKPLKRAILSGGYVFIGGIAGIAALFIPIYQEMPRFIGWAKKIITHDGTYGTGEQQFFTLNMFFSDQTRMTWAQSPFVLPALAIIIFLIVFSVYRINKSHIKISSSLFTLIATLSIQIVILFLMVSKAHAMPRYSLSIASILPIFLLGALKMLEFSSIKTVRLTQILFSVVLCGVAASLASGINAQASIANTEITITRSNSLVTRLMAREKQVDKRTIVTLYAYGTPIKCAGLVMANDWLAKFDNEISVLCPSQYAYYTAGDYMDLNSSRPLTKVNDVHWDILVARDITLLTDSLINVSTQNIPKSWPVKGAVWFFVHAKQK